MDAMKGRVLVVDDDTALAEMLGIVLRGEGFEPVFCADGARAFSVFRETRPDLVLLDLMLPGRDGIDVCKQIRAESGVPIVMLTAKTDTVDVVGYAHSVAEAVADARSTGGFAVLLRPTPVAAVAAVAAAGGRMPRKSTLFTPKPASGLLMRRFADES